MRAPCVVHAALIVVVSAAHASSPFPRNGETLILNDDFDSFNMRLWKHEITAGGGGNGEFQVYTNNRTTSWTENGTLVLLPRPSSDWLGDVTTDGRQLDLWGGSPADACTSNSWSGCSRTTHGDNIINPIMSARVRTAEHFAFKYGRLEARARLPRGDWIWPAIWLLPLDQHYGTWPASGEIDLMESRGNPPSYSGQGRDTVASTLHFGPSWQYDPWWTAHNDSGTWRGDLSSDFHTYGLFWNETRLYTYIDEDTPRGRVLDLDLTAPGMWPRGSAAQGWDALGLHNPWANSDASRSAPFDQMFYIIMNVAVGGTGGYFPDGVGNKPWKDSSPTAPLDFWKARDAWQPSWGQGTAAGLAVDYVRVWALPQSEYLLDGQHVSPKVGNK